MKTYLLAVGGLVAVACGTSEGASFSSGGGGRVAANAQASKSGSAGGEVTSLANGGQSLAGTNANGAASGVPTTSPNSGGSAGTASSIHTTGGTPPIPPTKIVFVYDKSGSMGNDPNGNWENMETRWLPMKASMVSFFHSAPPNTQASITFFPTYGTKEVICAADYQTPSAAMVSLSTPGTLITALDSASINGATPTLSALSGGLNYARALATADSSFRVMVVLVTDGEPAIYVVDPTTGQGIIDVDCAPMGSELKNTITDVATLAHRFYSDTPSIVTHVVGIGEAQDDMGTIATAGGGKFVYVNDPAFMDASLHTILQ